MEKTPSADDVLEIVQTDAVKAMERLDTWGRERGLDSDKRAALVSSVGDFVVSSSDKAAAISYVTKLAAIFGEIVGVKKDQTQ